MIEINIFIFTFGSNNLKNFKIKTHIIFKYSLYNEIEKFLLNVSHNLIL